MSCGLIYGSSFKIKGLKGGLHKFIEPIPLLLPINLMEVIIRPLSRACGCLAMYWGLHHYGADQAGNSSDLAHGAEHVF